MNAVLIIDIAKALYYCSYVSRDLDNYVLAKLESLSCAFFERHDFSVLSL